MSDIEFDMARLAIYCCTWGRALSLSIESEMWQVFNYNFI